MTQDADRFETAKERPTLPDEFWPQKERIWSEFMLNDRYAGEYWHYLNEDFPEWQIYLIGDDNAPAAVAQTIPCVWDGTAAGLPVGWAEGLMKGVESRQRGEAADTLMPLEISIAPDYAGQGVSYKMLNEVKRRAAEAGFKAVIVAVRPSLKSRYPITPMERYCHWLREDGAPFDPWLRAHWRVGGEILHIASPSMVIEGTADDWERWTGMKFPDSGDYIVPGALCPVQIDRTINFGRYIEPNVWVHHPITTARLRPDGVRKENE